MKTRTFSVVTSISMILALTVAILSIIGVVITGLYPGIIVLLLVALIPIASKFYAKKLLASPMISEKLLHNTHHYQFAINPGRVMDDICNRA